MAAPAASPHASLAGDIASFKNYMQAERGLAKNTVLAYGRDMERLLVWVSSGGLKNYLEPLVRELSHYLGYLRDENLAGPSAARHLVSLKMFYCFLRLDERV